ncbi:MAG: hypothetical protein K2N12_06715 [Helicobacter sp.]|nr:hypothetical protein [Helicobacter sp.]
MIKVFIPHRWKNDDYQEISALLDRTRFEVIDYSVSSDCPLKIDGRYNLDPQIQNRIKYASIVVCSNRPANNNGMAIDEIRFAVDIGKPVVAIKITNNTSSEIEALKIPVISKRKDLLENWIYRKVYPNLFPCFTNEH